MALKKLTIYPLVIVLVITLAGFYFLYKNKSQILAEIDQFKEKIDSIYLPNRNLHLRIRALTENSIISIQEMAEKTLGETVDAALNIIDGNIDGAKETTVSGETSKAQPKPEPAAPIEQTNQNQKN